MSSNAAQIRREMAELGNADVARHSLRFFKTGKGEYGEGDRFRGVRVPVIRKLVGRHRQASLVAIGTLMHSRFHEDRLFAVLSLVDRYKRGDDGARDAVFKLYLENLDCVNNWDIVDASAHLIVGPHLQQRDRSLLYELAGSDSLWDRRVAIISTYHFIRRQDFGDTLALSGLLIHDNEDLIHKAVGWMLREVGNRDIRVEEKFLLKHYAVMPRTMLRYAIEKFPEGRRKEFLYGQA